MNTKQVMLRLHTSPIFFPLATLSTFSCLISSLLVSISDLNSCLMSDLLSADVVVTTVTDADDVVVVWTPDVVVFVRPVVQGADKHSVRVWGCILLLWLESRGSILTLMSCKALSVCWIINQFKFRKIYKYYTFIWKVIWSTVSKSNHIKTTCNS